MSWGISEKLPVGAFTSSHGTVEWCLTADNFMDIVTFLMLIGPNVNLLLATSIVCDYLEGQIFRMQTKLINAMLFLALKRFFSLKSQFKRTIFKSQELQMKSNLHN